MTSVLVLVDGAKASPLAADLRAAGLQVPEVLDAVHQLMAGVVRHAPDLVAVDAPLPGEALFQALAALGATAPRPVLVFTNDVDARGMERALDAGVQVWAVQGYGAQRLRPLVQLAQVRFQREQALREELRELSQRFEERKLVERAKGILMRARQIADEEAFQLLRGAAMQGQQRLGQLAQQIIHSARYAEGVNRAGQLRMLSQRVIKLHLLGLAGVDEARNRTLLDESAARIEANLALLQRHLSQPTFGDLLAPLSEAWARLKPLLRGAAGAATSSAPAPVDTRADALADELLGSAERLTASLESASSVAPLRALNTAGRQRMLSQRYAKCTLLALLEPAAVSRHAQAMDEARQAFEQGQAYLQAAPLSTPAIREALDAASGAWQQMLAGAALAERATGRERQNRLGGFAAASEAVLDAFERLTEQVEHSMQLLIG
jgi:AmiR/NasT family two-component response regulator